MKVLITMKFGNILKISEEVYCDPTEEQQNECCKKILKAIQELKIK